MFAALHDPAMAYLRTKCGLPPKRTTVPAPDPDDPAGRLLTTAEAAEAAHVEVDRVRDWARRLILLPSDHRDGHPLYRELDVLRVEQRTRRSARSAALLAEAMEGLESPAT